VADRIPFWVLQIVVSLNVQSRAYPIHQLTGPSREIINDQLDGLMKGARLRQHLAIMSYLQAWQVFHPRSRDIALP
jgi:hypothetical protein